MSAEVIADLSDSGFVEVEFDNSDSAATFIVAANNFDVALFRKDDADGRPWAGYSFAAAPALGDSWFPPRNVFVTVRVPPGLTSDELTEVVRRFPSVRDVAPRPLFLPAFDPPSDPGIGENDQLPPGDAPPTQWYIHRCRVPKIWDRRVGGEGVVVADIDWGFFVAHKDFANRFDPEYSRNILDGTTDVTVGDVRHGTGAAGQIGAAANKHGIAGVAPECTLWFVQAGIVGKDGPRQPEGFLNPWATAIDWVIDKAPHVRKIINLEVQTGKLYSAESSLAIQGALRRARNAQVFVCVPAGNGRRSTDFTENGKEIGDTGGIVVAATGYDSFDNYRARFSNFGKRVSLAAPGEPKHDLTCGVASASDYTPNYGGTSGASAKAAGALALLLSHEPGLTHSQLMDIFRGLPPIDAPKDKPIGAFLDCEALFAGLRMQKIQDWIVRRREE